MKEAFPSFAATLPDLAAEIAAALVRSGEPVLAAQLVHLRMVGYDWSSRAVAIDTAPRTSWRDAPAGRNVVVDVRKGMVVLDVIADGTIERIVCIEVLGRGDVRARLRELAERGRERER